MTYPGGKNGSGTYQAIINLMPPHALYVEAFLGGGAIMRLKRPAIASIGIDANAAVISQRRNDLVAVPNLTLLAADTLQWLCDAPLPFDALIYLDPPYLMSTRRQQRQIYRHEFSDEQHAELLRIIQRLPCMVMISGYYSELYGTALNRWRAVRFQARTRGGSVATEWVWCNFPPPLELHDYRYLGRTFRQRQSIKRQIKRWQARLARMNPLQRHALMLAIGIPSAETTVPPATAPGPTIAAAGDQHTPEATIAATPAESGAAGSTAAIVTTDPGRPGNPGHK
jgi:hypothetical protein